MQLPLDDRCAHVWITTKCSRSNKGKLFWACTSLIVFGKHSLSRSHILPPAATQSQLFADLYTTLTSLWSAHNLIREHSSFPLEGHINLASKWFGDLDDIILDSPTAPASEEELDLACNIQSFVHDSDPREVRLLRMTASQYEAAPSKRPQSGSPSTTTWCNAKMLDKADRLADQTLAAHLHQATSPVPNRH